MGFQKGHNQYAINDKCSKCNRFLSKIKIHNCKPVWNKDKNHPKYQEWYEERKRIGFNNKGKSSWNKGLTKETDERLVNTSETHKKNYKLGINKCGFKNFKLPKSHYVKIANRMKNGGAIKARLSVKFNRISKPELQFKKILDTFHINYEQQFKLNKYFFDFYLPNYKLLIEIDGRYWHNYPDYKKSDWFKNDVCCNNGYYLLRFWEHEVLCKKLILFNLNNIFKHIQEHEVMKIDNPILPTLSGTFCSSK